MYSQKTASVITLLTALALSGCIKLGPDFSKPEAPLAAAWLDIDGKRVKVEDADYREWWKSLKDPVLDNLIQTAYRQNLTIQQAGLRIYQARASLGIAVGNWFPQTQAAVGDYSYTRQSAYAPGSQQAAQFGGMDNNFSQGQFGATAGWELDFWGKYARGIESADALMISEMAAYDQALVSLIGDVAATYVQIRVLEQRLIIARSSVASQSEGYKIAKARFDGGATSERDVQQALTQLSGTEATIPDIEQQLQQTKNALSILLGMPPAQLASVLPPALGNIPQAPPTLAVSVPADLLRRRPDIRQAEYAAAAQSALIGATEAELYPAFSLTGNFGFLATDQAGGTVGDMFNWDGRTGTVGPTFQWPVFNYGRITNAVRVQDAQFEILVAQYQQTVLQAQREVENAVVAFVKSAQRVGFLTKAVAAAKKTVDLVLVEYRDGATDYTTVITAEQALLQQQDGLVQAQGGIPQAAIALYRAFGGGWEIRECQDFVPAATIDRMKKSVDWGEILSSAAVEEAETEAEKGKTLRSVDW